VHDAAALRILLLEVTWRQCERGGGRARLTRSLASDFVAASMRISFFCLLLAAVPPAAFMAVSFLLAFSSSLWTRL
jgi:hypothetical protein